MIIGKRLSLKKLVKILHKLVKTKHSRPKEPTRVSARVLARRASAEAAAVATRLLIKGVVAGAAVEEIQASESVSTLEEQQAVDYHFLVFLSTRCHYSIIFCGKRIAPITTSTYLITN